MGQQQSKDELLYQQVSYGNAAGIKALRRDGAGLEWIDREGKTPLILACMSAELYDVTKTLIELGANVNAYRSGRHAGTPLHHAAKRGLENTVKLLLSHSANPLVLNDNCQTPLEVARVKGYSNVVRAIESHICLYSGWMREFYGPGFLEVFAPQLLSRRVWVVILPTGSRNPTKPFKLELSVYASLQDAQPRTRMELWKANLEEPKPNQSDSSVIIIDNSTKLRLKLAPANEGDREQLHRFCDACKGIPQSMNPPAFMRNPQTASAPPTSEDLELAMAINASLQSATNQMPGLDHCSISEEASSSSTVPPPPPPPPEARASDFTTHEGTIPEEPKPSAPPFVDDVITTAGENGHIHYPSIDSSPIEVPSLSPVMSVPATGEKNEEGSSGTCSICLDAPSEAACVPCGHVAGCMSCLNEIKSKKWGCPVCRAEINQVIKLYRV
ncbi:PREDICTED: putative E3 ubiquitin-protein ligase XBAT35 [Tarenaya hassleriana]|uniref:putative E3 ubiquitin-protein ligase XBAT35 n=1 Tax=Tarenaya hassleriana TaxID=28532 RepID=UPI00053C73A0|nr:PREDICTED: putative E3 ubiquitin-protein ligase XBAT35 [Tarenaya hassleriana]